MTGPGLDASRVIEAVTSAADAKLSEDRARTSTAAKRRRSVGVFIKAIRMEFFRWVSGVDTPRRCAPPLSRGDLILRRRESPLQRGARRAGWVAWSRARTEFPSPWSSFQREQVLHDPRQI